MSSLEAKLPGEHCDFPKLLQACAESGYGSKEAKKEGENPVMASEEVSLGNCCEDDTLENKEKAEDLVEIGACVAAIRLLAADIALAGFVQSAPIL